MPSGVRREAVRLGLHTVAASEASQNAATRTAGRRRGVIRREPFAAQDAIKSSAGIEEIRRWPRQISTSLSSNITWH
jgi:hypothetical protein